VKVLAVFVTLLAGLSTSADAAATKFDLVCFGSAEALRGKEKTVERFARTFHIDLDSSKYCVDICDTILDVFLTDPLMITLVHIPRHGNAFNMRMAKQTIDRRTGELVVFDFDAAKLRSTSVKANCTPSPFTPFPTTKF
jgi:hypothetical protein